MNQNALIALGVIVIIAIGGAVSYLSYRDVQVQNAPGQYDTLAQCLTEKGVKFFGAFWCPHCQNQKKTFGNSAKLLPYVECSTPDGQGQLQVCKDAGVSSYPTWIFADGTKLNGEQEPGALAMKAGCALPDGFTVPTSTTTAGASSEATE